MAVSATDDSVTEEQIRKWHDFQLAQYAWAFEFDLAKSGVTGQYTEFGNIDTNLPFLEDNEVAELVALQPLDHTVWIEGEGQDPGYVVADDELAIRDLQENQQTEYGNFDTNTSGDSVVSNQTEASVVMGLDSLYRSHIIAHNSYEDQTNTTGGGAGYSQSGVPDGHMINFRQELGRGPILDKDNNLQWGGQHVFSPNLTDNVEPVIQVAGSFNIYFDVFETESARYRDIKG